MRKVSGAAGAALLALASVVALIVSFQARSNAHDTLEQALQLYEARLQVAHAQEDLGNSDLGDAIKSAGQANDVARHVKTITTRIARLLATAEDAASSTSRTSRRAVQNVSLARGQTVTSSEVLALIAGYQRAASSFADDTNAALVRILRAVRKTNRSFPGRG